MTAILSTVDSFFQAVHKWLVIRHIKFNESAYLLLTVLVEVLTSVVEGKTEKGGGGKAATVKPVSGANVSDTALGTVKTPPLAPFDFMSEKEKAKSVAAWEDFAKRCEAPPQEMPVKPKPKKKGKK